MRVTAACQLCVYSLSATLHDFAGDRLRGVHARAMSHLQCKSILHETCRAAKAGAMHTDVKFLTSPLWGSLCSLASPSLGMPIMHSLHNLASAFMVFIPVLDAVPRLKQD